MPTHPDSGPLGPVPESAGEIPWIGLWVFRTLGSFVQACHPAQRSATRLEGLIVGKRRITMPEYPSAGLYHEYVGASPPAIRALRTEAAGFVGISACGSLEMAARLSQGDSSRPIRRLYGRRFPGLRNPRCR